MNSKVQAKSYSWGLVVLMFFIFFPVGIFLLIQKVTSEKTAYTQNGKTLKGIGWFCVGVSVFMAFAFLTGIVTYDDGTSAAGVGVLAVGFYGAIGILGIKKGSSMIAKGTKYDRYNTIVMGSQEYAIDSIANLYPSTYEEAVADLQAMLTAGYFTGARLDLAGRRLIFPEPPAKEQPAPAPQVQAVHIVCRHCGATNKIIPGTDKVCAYCDSRL